MKQVAGFALMVFVVFLLASCSSQIEVEYLRERLASAEGRIQYLEEQEDLRQEHDRSVYLVDSPGFVASGVVRLSQFEVYETQTYLDHEGYAQTRFVYKLNGGIGLVESFTGEWIELNAVMGETIYLMTYGSVDGISHVGYYTCYTNSTNCDVTPTNTNVLVRE